MTALKRRAERQGVVGQKGCFQHILTMLQLQVIVVDKAPALAEIVDVLIRPVRRCKISADRASEMPDESRSAAVLPGSGSGHCPLAEA